MFLKWLLYFSHYRTNHLACNSCILIVTLHIFQCFIGWRAAQQVTVVCPFVILVEETWFRWIILITFSKFKCEYSKYTEVSVLHHYCLLHNDVVLHHYSLLVQGDKGGFLLLIIRDDRTDKSCLCTYLKLSLWWTCV